jgi:hypothetical protein
MIIVDHQDNLSPEVTKKVMDRNRLFSFLKDVKFRKFESWPDLQPECINDYLFQHISQIATQGIVFESFSGKDTTALLAADFLDWDAIHFGFKCMGVRYLFCRKSADTAANRRDLASVVAMFKQYCSQSGIEFASIDVDSWDSDATFILQDAGFKYILTWIDAFAREPINCIDKWENLEIGILHQDELPQLAAMCAEQYFGGGRFYLDCHFDRAKVDQMYSNLVRSSYENNDIMLACRMGGKVMGLIISKNIASDGSLGGKRVASMRFIILAQELRGAGVGRLFFARGARHLLDRYDIVTTGLEVHNLASLNMVSRAGFKFNYTHSVYHWWRSNN